MVNLELIIVHSYYRGLGIQREIILRLEREAKDNLMEGIVLTVHPKNTYAISNYEKMGYVCIGTTPDKYFRGERNYYRKDIV